MARAKFHTTMAQMRRLAIQTLREDLKNPDYHLDSIGKRRPRVIAEIARIFPDATSNPWFTEAVKEWITPVAWNRAKSTRATIDNSKASRIALVLPEDGGVDSNGNKKYVYPRGGAKTGYIKYGIVREAEQDIRHFTQQIRLDIDSRENRSYWLGFYRGASKGNDEAVIGDLVNVV